MVNGTKVYHQKTKEIGYIVEASEQGGYFVELENAPQSKYGPTYVRWQHGMTMPLQSTQGINNGNLQKETE